MHLDEIFKMTHPTQGELKTLGDIWQRAVPTESSKAASITVNNTRKTGGDGTTYPSFAADKVMPSLKAFGAAVQRKHKEALWGRYQPVEYITLSGTQHINLAPLTTEEDIEITFRRITADTNFLFGTNPSSSSSTAVGAWANRTSLVIQNGNHRDTIDMDTNWHTVKVTSTGNYLDGISKGSAGTRSSFQNLIVGAARTQSSAAVDDRGFRGDIAHVKVGTHDFIPVKDIVDNVYGMWDRVEGKFYGNAGTGAFTGGSLIQRVEYLQSSGSEWIDTGLIGNEKTKIVIDFAKETTASAMQPAGTITTPARAISCNIGNDWTAVSRFGSKSYGGQVVFDTNQHILEIANDGYKLDGTLIWTPNESAFTTPDSLLLGGVQGSTSYFEGNMYSAQFYEDNTLVRDYLPVRIGTVGYMLDTVEWKLYGNAGTGAFAYGEDTTEVYDLVCNKGVLEYGVGKNLFDDSGANWVQGRYIADDGIIMEDSTSSYERLYIPIKPNTTYTLSGFGYTGGQGSVRVHGYTEDKTWTALIGKKGLTYHAVTFTTGANDSYVRFSGKGFVDTQLEEGSTVTEYEPYFRGIRADGSHKVKITTLHSPWDNGCYDNGTLGEVCKCVDITVPNGEYTVKTNCIKESSHPDIATIFTTNGHFPVSFSTSANGVFVDAPRTVTVTGGVISIGVRYLSSIGYKTYPTKETYNADGVWIKIYNSSGEEIGDNITVDITDILPSATSYLDIQKSTNNVVKDWDIIWYDGTQTIPDSYISQTGDLTPNQIVAYALAASATSTDALTPISLSTKGEKTIAAEAEIPVTVQATVLSK